jgi:hypothetical protein
MNRQIVLAPPGSRLMYAWFAPERIRQFVFNAVATAVKSANKAQSGREEAAKRQFTPDLHLIYT